MKKNIKLIAKLKKNLIKSFFIFGVFLLTYFYHIIFIALTFDSIITRIIYKVNFDLYNTFFIIVINILFVLIAKFINSKIGFNKKDFKEKIEIGKEYIENLKK